MALVGERRPVRDHRRSAWEEAIAMRIIGGPQNLVGADVIPQDVRAPLSLPRYYVDDVAAIVSALLPKCKVSGAELTMLLATERQWSLS